MACRMRTLESSSCVLSPRRRVCVAAGACLLVLCASAQGVAEGRPSGPETGRTEERSAGSTIEADALIARGLELREQGKDLAALQRFQAAYDLTLSPRALAQCGWAEQALGRWAVAEEHLTEALSSDQDPWVHTRRATLEQSLAVIGQHLTDLRLYGGVAGAEVRLDGKLLGNLPLEKAMRVEPGKSMLEVSLDGYYPLQREITLRAGGLATESIELVPRQSSNGAYADPYADHSDEASAASAAADLPPGSAQTAASAARKPEAAGGLPSWVFWSTASATVVVGAFAIGSALDTRAQRDDYVAYATSDAAVYEEARQRFIDADGAQTRTNALLVATGASALVSVVVGAFFTQWEPREHASAAYVAADLKPRWRVAVAGPGLRVDGQF